VSTRVLVIEPDDAIRQELEATLRRLRFSFLGSAATPHRAVEAFRACTPDVIILSEDLLGDDRGAETLQVLERFQPAPVIYLTEAEKPAAHRRKIAHNRYDGFVSKPINVPSLYFALETAVEQFRLERKLERSEEVYRTLEEDRRKAEQADRAKSEFLATMSHEIRTPMNSVIGFAELLLEDDITDEQRDHVQMIQSAGTALLGLINDILDLSKIESGNLSVETVEFSLPNVVESVVRVLDIEAMKKVVTLSVDLGETVPDSVSGDPGRLRQVLFNLVGNAVKFTDQGEVRLSVSHEDDTLQFRVSDTGCGIAEHELDELFKPFTQVGADIGRRTRGGTGLGLAISKRLVELMGGSIGVESTPGVGSVFSFEIPYRPGKLPVLDDAVIEPDGAEPRSAHVLVVEDDRINQKVLRTVLQRSGHRATIAETGTAALEALRTQRFSLCFMDMRLPDIDGPEITRRFRASSCEAAQQLPIVGLTASAYQEDKDACLNAGMNAVLTKPIELDQIRRAVHQYALPDAIEPAE